MRQSCSSGCAGALGESGPEATRPRLLPVPFQGSLQSLEVCIEISVERRQLRFVNPTKLINDCSGERFVQVMLSQFNKLHEDRRNERVLILHTGASSPQRNSPSARKPEALP